MAKTAMAIACHPDDIDFGMSGTLMMLKKAGYEIHYMDVANGSLGTAEYTYEEIVKIRLEEAKNSGATGLFESRYGERVRVYTMGEFSKEICGGPHASNTGDLVSFKIQKEESSSRGVRRIKAVIGK